MKRSSCCAVSSSKLEAELLSPACLVPLNTAALHPALRLLLSV